MRECDKKMIECGQNALQSQRKPSEFNRESIYQESSGWFYERIEIARNEKLEKIWIMMKEGNVSLEKILR